MEIKKLSLEFFVEKLNNREPFSFARYGDGEFSAILGVKGHNCDGHEYFQDMGKALAKTLEEPRAGNYFYGIGPKITGRDNRLTKKTISWLYAHTNNIQWNSSEVLLEASLAGELTPFVEALKKYSGIVVGPQHLMPFGNYLFDEHRPHICIPSLNAWNVYENTLREIRREAYRCNIIIFSAGPVSKILIWSLFPWLGTTHTMIDCGSLWDMYRGIKSRSYARKLSDERIEELCKLNFGEQKAVSNANP